MKQFDGLDVTESAITIAKAGEGLNDGTDLPEIAIGDRVYVVLDTVCTKVLHEEVPNLNELRRVPTLRTVMSAIVDGKSVQKALDTQRKANDAANGQPQLGDEGDEDAA